MVMLRIIASKPPLDLIPPVIYVTDLVASLLTQCCLATFVSQYSSPIAIIKTAYTNYYYCYLSRQMFLIPLLFTLY